MKDPRRCCLLVSHVSNNNNKASSHLRTQSVCREWMKNSIDRNTTARRAAGNAMNTVRLTSLRPEPGEDIGDSTSARVPDSRRATVFDTERSLTCVAVSDASERVLGESVVRGSERTMDPMLESIISLWEGIWFSP